MTSLVSYMMDDSDVEATESLWVYYHTILSQQVMRPTLLARVIVTENYLLTLLQVCMLITPLGVSLPQLCCCCRKREHIRHLFSDVEGLQCITDITLGLLEHASIHPLTLRIALV